MKIIHLNSLQNMKLYIGKGNEDENLTIRTVQGQRQWDRIRSQR